MSEIESHNDEPHLSPVLQQKIDDVCDKFEAAFRADAMPRIEDYLERVPEAIRRSALRELIGVELQLLEQRGIAIDANSYVLRFPGNVEVANDLLQCAARGDSSEDQLKSSDFAAANSTEEKRVESQGQENTLESLPERLGRYEIRGLLGRGTYGLVCLADDPQLNRQVAIKIPSRKVFGIDNRVELFLAEASNAARLTHPGLVAVYDVQVRGDQPYIVQEYVDGFNLREWKQTVRPTNERIVHLLISIVDAVGYAHQQGLIHRDLKPKNILVDHRDKPHVADFGLAVHESVQREKKGEISGSPAYMSPEQVRGETHRLDGCTDIWSIGVILYELLLDRRPFLGTKRRELFDAILAAEPKPPRQLDPAISKELERICLKCLEKRRSDRYTSAADLLEDLHHWLDIAMVQAPSVPASAPKVATAADGDSTNDRSAKIVPKGLRSFDRRDSDFFLELLPGPRDRDGLPGSIRFWKTRIEESGPEQTFSVGLIYGPSGCGKSSLVKAGLLPRLTSRVLPMYIEATPDDTEVRLLKAFSRRLPKILDGGSLPDATRRIREQLTPGHKVLIVLDQFEQWLHVHGHEESSQLADALRHCDGSRLQCLIMVRDDFWMAITRFMKSLEIRLMEGENSSAADLFPLRHAENVLIEFGRAYGRLGQDGMTPSQREFVAQSAEALAEEGKVVCVRLALFADMMKDKPWTPTSLKAVGGMEGVGVVFLEETFSSRSAPRRRRIHGQAARHMLKALLPDPGISIRGHMCSEAELLQASGYTDREEAFDELMGIMDGETRLLTPVLPDAFGESNSSKYNERYFHLTHDYLVPSVRRWLHRKHKETWKGRAELRLEELAQLWQTKPETRYLPSAHEFILIRALTRTQDWADSQRQMMRHAGRRVVMCGLGFLACLLALTGLMYLGYAHSQRLHARDLVESLRAAKTAALLADLDTMEFHEIPLRIKPLADRWRWVRPELTKIVRESDDNLARLNASSAFLFVERTEANYLRTQLKHVAADDFSTLCNALLWYRNRISDEIWRASVIDPTWKEFESLAAPSERFRAGCALAFFDPTNETWEANSRHADFLTAQLIDRIVRHPTEYAAWVEGFRPIGIHLLRPLSLASHDSNRRQTERIMATNILVEYGDEDVSVMAELIAEANAEQFEITFTALARDPEQATKYLSQILDRSPDVEGDPVTLARRQANAAVALLRLGTGEDRVWRLLRHSDDPTLRSYIVHFLASRGVSFDSVIRQLGSATEPSIRRALILTVGEYAAHQLEEMQQSKLIQSLLDSFRGEEDPGVRAAAEWLLRRWNVPLVELTQHLSVAEDDEVDFRNSWYVNSQQQTMVVFSNPITFTMGSDESEPGRDPEDREFMHRRHIGRPFAFAVHPVTVEQFLRFDHDFTPRYSDRSDEYPAHQLSWYEAAAYCNWLSEKEKIPREQWCYAPTTTPPPRFDWTLEDFENIVPRTHLDTMSANWQDGFREYVHDLVQRQYGGRIEALVRATNDVQSLHWRDLFAQIGSAPPELYHSGMRIVPNCLALTGYRMPTEAEAEYVCRANSDSMFFFGQAAELLEEYAWHHENSQQTPWRHILAPIGSTKPNDFGFFDMHGNVMFWCQDSFRKYQDLPRNSAVLARDSLIDDVGVPNGETVSDGDQRVLRGSSLLSPPRRIRSAYRAWYSPGEPLPDVGIRLARTIPDPTESEQIATNGPSSQ